jgi:hypothetical protein
MVPTSAKIGCTTGRLLGFPKLTYKCLDTGSDGNPDYLISPVGELTTRNSLFGVHIVGPVQDWRWSLIRWSCENVDREESATNSTERTGVIYAPLQCKLYSNTAHTTSEINLT